jgi:hypothetical protein
MSGETDRAGTDDQCKHKEKACFEFTFQGEKEPQVGFQIVNEEHDIYA